MRDVEAARTTFVPSPLRKPRKRQNKTAAVTRSVQLPSRLSYLQAAFDELLALPAEQRVEDDDQFYSLLEDAMRRRTQGLSLADAKARIEADRQELESWTDGRRPKIPAAEIILTLFHPINVAGMIQAMLERNNEPSG